MTAYHRAPDGIPSHTRSRLDGLQVDRPAGIGYDSGNQMPLAIRSSAVHPSSIRTSIRLSIRPPSVCLSIIRSSIPHPSVCRLSLPPSSVLPSFICSSVHPSDRLSVSRLSVRKIVSSVTRVIFLLHSFLFKLFSSFSFFISLFLFSTFYFLHYFRTFFSSLPPFISFFFPSIFHLFIWCDFVCMSP